MIIGELTFYVLIGAVATTATVVYAVWVRQFSGAKLRFALAAPYATALIALGYFGMAGELLRVHSASGRAVPMTRFLVYLLSYTVIVSYIGLIADADRRHILMGTGFLSLFAIGALINWLTAPPIEFVGKLMFLGGLVGQMWVLFGPYTRASEGVSGARHLTFGKLRNLMALLLLMYLVVGLTARQGLGLLGTFSGIYMGAYLDVIGHLGFAGILLRSETAIDHLAGEWSSPLDYVQHRGLQPSESEATVGD